MNMLPDKFKNYFTLSSFYPVLIDVKYKPL